MLLLTLAVHGPLEQTNPYSNENRERSERNFAVVDWTGLDVPGLTSHEEVLKPRLEQYLKQKGEQLDAHWLRIDQRLKELDDDPLHEIEDPLHDGPIDMIQPNVQLHLTR